MGRGRDREAIKSTGKTEGVKGKGLYMPLRVAVTGFAHRPDLVSILEIEAGMTCSGRSRGGGRGATRRVKRIGTRRMRPGGRGGRAMSGRKMRIAVLLGGDSAERDVSIASAAGVMEALRNRGHEVRPVDPALPEGMQGDPASAKIGEKPPEAIGKIERGKAFEWLTGDGISGADVVFIALHGGSGEDGTVQALLEAAGAVYTGTGILGSALAMNKDRAKALFREAGVQTARAYPRSPG